MIPRMLLPVALAGALALSGRVAPPSAARAAATRSSTGSTAGESTMARMAGMAGMSSLPRAPNTPNAPNAPNTPNTPNAPNTKNAPSIPPKLAVPSVPTPSDSVREYRGTYETGFEVSWFHPCGAPAGDDLWWVTLSDEALRQRDSLARTLQGAPGSVYVRWRGTISDRMPAGHMGRGSRYMLVVEVLELRPAVEAACSAA